MSFCWALSKISGTTNTKNTKSHFLVAVAHWNSMVIHFFHIYTVHALSSFLLYLLVANSGMCYTEGVKLRYIFVLQMVHFQNVWKLHFCLEAAYK